MKPRIQFEIQLLAAFVAAVLTLALLLFSTIKIARDNDMAMQAVAHTQIGRASCRERV